MTVFNSQKIASIHHSIDTCLKQWVQVQTYSGGSISTVRKKSTGQLDRAASRTLEDLIQLDGPMFPRR